VKCYSGIEEPWKQEIYT